MENAERYALGDFKKHGYLSDIKDDEPVPMSVDFCKKWKDYDTVLVDESQYFQYCNMAGLPVRSIDDWHGSSTATLPE